MTAQRKLAAPGLISLLLLSGCDDPNAANVANFEKALQQYYDVHPVCVSLPFTLPLENSADLDDHTRRQLDVLASLGLVSATPPRTAAVALSVLGDARDGRRYDVAAAGGKSIRKGANTFLGGTDICFAHRRVVRIDTFTQPVDEMAMTVSRVTYQYDLDHVESWAKDGQIQETFPEIKAALAHPISSVAESLVLTNAGWRHEGAIR